MLEAKEEKPNAYINGCALRVSYALNNAMQDIPKGDIPGCANIFRLKGGDGKPYIMRVAD